MMPPKKKRSIALVNQEKLSEDFYNHLEDDTFFWNEFLNENDDEVSDCSLMLSDDGSNDDNTEEIVKLENDSNVRESHAPEVPRKQKFANIDEITVLDNFDSLPSQEHNVFHYSDTKDTFFMSWHTDKISLEEPLP